MSRPTSQQHAMADNTPVFSDTLPDACIPTKEIIFKVYDPICKTKGGRDARNRLLKWHEMGILNPLSPLVVLEKILRAQDLKTPGTKANNLGYVQALIGKLRPTPEVLGYTSEQLEQLFDEYNTLVRQIKQPSVDMRAQGVRSESDVSNWHDFDDIKAKYLDLLHTIERRMLPGRPMRDQDFLEYTTVVFALSSLLMCNTRSVWLTVKVANVDPLKDNFVTMTLDTSSMFVTFNKTKATKHMFTQAVPHEYAAVLNRYDAAASLRHPDREYLFVNSRGGACDPHAVQSRLLDLSRVTFNKTLGIARLRRIQVAHMGPRSTEAELTTLARAFHHSFAEHMRYFTLDPAEPDPDA